MQFQDISYSYSNGFAILAEGLTNRLMKQNREPRYTHKYIQLIFDKIHMQFHRRKIAFLAKGTGVKRAP